jgi:hypothetical protein
MNKKPLIYALVLVLAGLLLAACGGSEPDPIATQVAVERAVAATLTAEAPQPAPTEVALAPTVTLIPTDAPSPTPSQVAAEPTATQVPSTPTQVPPTATQVPPTATQVPPTATQVPPTPTQVPPTATAILPPSPTPITVAVLPVDGNDGNQNLVNDHPVNGGRNITLPGFAQYEVSNPMVFRQRMVFQAEVRDRNVGHHDGAGIDNVRFTITDNSGQQVHFRQENNAGYCVFGGGEPDCNVWGFAETGNRWPDGALLSAGIHFATIDITPQHGEPVSWVWSFRVELP